MSAPKISRIPVVGGKKSKERPVPFSERIKELVDNLDGFFAYNPAFVQEGPMQVAISAKLDDGSYQYAADRYAEKVLVSKTPRKGADFYVARLGAARLTVAGKNGKRCLYSQTYYVWPENGHFRCRLLLDNGEQFQAKKVDAAFDWMVSKVKGRKLCETPDWFYFRLADKLNSFGRILCYWDKDEELRVLICMPNSGTILDYEASTVEIGEVLQPGCYCSTRFLGFCLDYTGDIRLRRTLSQKELEG